MSYVESPVETVEKFAATPGWKKASIEEISADLFSIGNESNLKWDKYLYFGKNGRLYDPIRKRNVAGTGGNTAEEEVIDQLEDWFFTHYSGIAVSISPRSEVLPYPEEKIAIHRIAYDVPGKKVMLCVSHMFKTSFRNPEEIRRFIFTEEDNEESILKIIAWLTTVSEKEVEQNVDQDDLRRRLKQAEYYAYQYKSDVSVNDIIYDMKQSRFLGENSISCGGGGGTLSAIILGSSNKLDFSEGGKFVRNCGKCGTPINSTISKGYRCASCGGVYEGC